MESGGNTYGSNPVCNALGYAACEIAYDQCEAWLNKLLSVIRENHQIIADYMTKEFPQIDLIDMQGTYLLWMDWSRLGISFRELERINRMEAQLFFDEGFIFGEQGENFERWNLACPTSCITAALERMKTTYSAYIQKH